MKTEIQPISNHTTKLAEKFERLNNGNSRWDALVTRHGSVVLFLDDKGRTSAFAVDINGESTPLNPNAVRTNFPDLYRKVVELK